jgi:hypothetical protein
MTRFWISSLLFLFILSIEAAFVHALPDPLAYAPLVFACSVVLVQHHGAKDGAWWIMGTGVFLDLWRIGIMPYETIAYALTGAAVLIVSPRLFTNRSLYGVAGCAILGFFVLHAVHGLLLLMGNWKNVLAVPWGAFGLYMLWQLAFLLILTTVLFLSSTSVRHLLRRLLLLPRTHETL